MKDLKIFIDLTRLNRPIGYLLLFWPCSWGLAYAYSFNKNIEIFLFYILLGFSISVNLMCNIWGLCFQYRGEKDPLTPPIKIK